MARLPKVKLRAIPVFPSNVTGATGVTVAKANGAYTIKFDVSGFNIANVLPDDMSTTYAISFGHVTTDNPLGSYSLTPFSGFQGLSSDLTSLAELDTTGIVARIGDADFVTRTITGTASRLTVTNGGGISGNPTLDISTSYVGQSTITTLGTVVTGTWQATTVAVGYGGTGLTTYAVGDLLYANTTSTLARLADVATTNVLLSGGIGVAPSWGKVANAALSNSTISGVALGSNLGTLTFGTHLSSGGASYNGSTGVTITSDATAVNTASTIMARDGSGQVAATTFTGALAGNATTATLASTVTTNANLTGDVTSVGNATTLTNAPVIAKVLTGYVSGAGTISATDSILSAIQKLNGNDATNANLTGDVTSVGNATTLAAGSASNLNSGTLLAARMPALTGEATTSAGAVAVTLTNSAVIGKVLTGYTSGAGTVAATDTILQAIQKLNGNDATNANLTGDVTSVGNATTLAAGSASNLNSGTLLAARMPALTGDITTSSGAVATAIGATKVTSAMLNADVFSTAHSWGGTQTFTAPVLGAATATSINGNTFTTGTYTLTGTAGKTLNFTNTITLSGTDSTTMTFPSTSATLARTDAANTFTGTQTVGALVATTINGNTFTTGTGTLTIAAAKTATHNASTTFAGTDGKTLTISNSLTLAGTDSTTMTFPTTSATLARTDAANTFTGTQTFSSTITGSVSGSAATLTTARAIDGQNFDGSAAITVIAPGTHAATTKATPVDADELPLVDSAASNVLKKLTWANLKTTLATLFAPIASPTFTGTATAPTFAATSNISSAATLDASATLYTLTAGATFDVVGTSSGLLILSDNTFTGSTALVVTGGNSLSIIGQSQGTTWVNSSSPSATQFGVFYNAGTTTYRIKNGAASSAGFYAQFLKTRPNL